MNVANFTATCKAATVIPAWGGTASPEADIELTWDPPDDENYAGVQFVAFDPDGNLIGPLVVMRVGDPTTVMIHFHFRAAPNGMTIKAIPFDADGTAAAIDDTTPAQSIAADSVMTIARNAASARLSPKNKA